MKYTMKRMLALFIALLLAMPGFAFAEEPGDVAGNDGEVFIGSDVDPEAGEGEAELGGDEEPQEPAALMATYWFIAGDALYAEVVVSDGSEIVLPEDPEAPEGMAFAGWFLEDETPLFADDDEDHIARVDPLCPFVNVVARFVEVGEADGEETTSSVSPDGETASPEGEAIEDGENVVENEDELPSPLGEGVTQSVTEEVVTTDESDDETEDKEEDGATTSDASLGLRPVSPDGETASPEGEAIGDDEENVDEK